jgi:hypothetical protein
MPVAGPVDPSGVMSRSADYAQRDLRRAATLYEPGELMPVDIVGCGLGQRPGDPEPRELSHPPFMDKAVLIADSFVVRPHFFFFQPVFLLSTGSVNG